MDAINSTKFNTYPQAQNTGETQREAGGQGDRVDTGKKPGHITCYMYAKLKESKDVDQKQLAQFRMEAINNAINDGSITPEAAMKLM